MGSVPAKDAPVPLGQRPDGGRGQPWVFSRLTLSGTTLENGVSAAGTVNKKEPALSSRECSTEL